MVTPLARAGRPARTLLRLAEEKATGVLAVLEVAAGELTPLSRRRPGASRVGPRDPAPELFDRSDPEVVDRLMSAPDSLRAARRFGDPPGRNPAQNQN